MLTYILRRLLYGLIVIVIASMLVFLLMRLLPGDPVTLYIAQTDLANYSPEQIHALHVQFGLDKPLPVQYGLWILRIFHGNFGTSTAQYVPVSSILAQRVPITLHLGILAAIFSAVVAISAGMICALRRGSWLDTVITSLTNIGIGAPIFWLAILLMYLFSIKLRWLPAFGYTSPFKDFTFSIKQLIMPVVCLSVGPISFITRQTRASVLEIVRQEYIRTAWSKGLKEWVIVLRHILKNSIIPIVTLVGLQFSNILGGSVLVETVFNIPGMGRMMIQAVFARDYPIVQAGAFLITIFVVLVNIIVDISYGWMDPRIRYT